MVVAAVGLVVGRVCDRNLPNLRATQVLCGSDSLPEWSKGVDSSSTSESCVGSNPTAVIRFDCQERLSVREALAEPTRSFSVWARIVHGAHRQAAGFFVTSAASSNAPVVFTGSRQQVDRQVKLCLSLRQSHAPPMRQPQPRQTPTRRANTIHHSSHPTRASPPSHPPRPGPCLPAAGQRPLPPLAHSAPSAYPPPPHPPSLVSRIVPQPLFDQRDELVQLSCLSCLPGERPPHLHFLAPKKTRSGSPPVVPCAYRRVATLHGGAPSNIGGAATEQVLCSCRCARAWSGPCGAFPKGASAAPSYQEHPPWGSNPRPQG